jgi:replicative DNA helicase
MKSQELPNAHQVEASVISALLTVPNSIYNCIQLLNEDCFYQKKYKILWTEIVQMHKENVKIDIVHIVERIKAKNKLKYIGGIQHLMEITGQYFTSDVSSHAKILYQKYMRRNAIEQASVLIKDSFNDSADIFDVLNQSKSKLFDCLQPSVSRTVTAHDAILSNLREISDNLGKFQEVKGVPTGFMDIDKRTGGFGGGHFIVIGGRPSMGKTTFVLNAAWNAFKKFGHSGMFFSCEMSSKEIVRLIMAKETSVPAEDIRKNKVTKMQIEEMYRIFDSMETKEKVFLIDDTPNANITHILAEATRAKQKHDIKFVVVDYLQLIKANSKSRRHEQVSEISRELKALARNLDIPVIALAQLSRGVENRDDKRPKLSDLKESGDIEQDADAVGFLYRPEYYGITEDENNNSLVGLTEMVWRKNRHGEIGIDMLYMDKKNSEFHSFCSTSGHTTSVDEYDMRLTQMQDMNEGIDNFKQRIGQNE